MPDEYGDQLSEEVEGMSEAQIINFVKNKIDVYNFVATYFAQILILNDDWSGTITGANMKTFFTTGDKIVRAHYDLDLSILTGKFAPLVPTLRFDGFKYSLPPSLESDKSILRDVCTKDSFPFSGVEKYAPCVEIIEKVVHRKASILTLINEFPYIPDPKKNEIQSRVETFFTALSGALVELEN